MVLRTLTPEDLQRVWELGEWVRNGIDSTSCPFSCAVGEREVQAMFLSPAYILLRVGVTGHVLYREFLLGLLRFLQEPSRKLCV